jgi:hypothetical protein
MPAMKSLVLIPSVLLASCASPGPGYEPPAGAQRGNLLLERVNVDVLMISIYSDARNCSAPLVLGAKGREFYEGKPFPLEAGKEYAVQMKAMAQASILSIATCVQPATFSFKPEANQNYKARYIVDLKEKSCRFSLARVGVDGKEAVEPSFRVRTPLGTQFQPNQPNCQP